mmetsp:Transcript_57151/g.170361  ORF Transcript_57151/g.170361 Transcript_57151/m.170361 type:complete len:233 (+) Transcript_57151:1643-2341(+)
MGVTQGSVDDEVAVRDLFEDDSPSPSPSGGGVRSPVAAEGGRGRASSPAEAAPSSLLRSPPAPPEAFLFLLSSPPISSITFDAAPTADVAAVVATSATTAAAAKVAVAAAPAAERARLRSRSQSAEAAASRIDEGRPSLPSSSSDSLRFLDRPPVGEGVVNNLPAGSRGEGVPGAASKAASAARGAGFLFLPGAGVSFRLLTTTALPPVPPVSSAAASTGANAAYAPPPSLL